MDNIKIENFHRDFPDRTFPEYRALTEHECEEEQRKIVRNFEFPHQARGLPLLLEIRAISVQISNINAQEDGFLLQDVLKEVKLLSQNIFINWYRFDRIDSMNLNALCSHFDNIWYPSLDDIELWDSSAKWMLSISHSGDVFMARSASIGQF